jgi:hypothetical protein
LLDGCCEGRQHDAQARGMRLCGDGHNGTTAGWSR